MIDLEAVNTADVAHKPFSYFVASNVLSPSSFAEVSPDFPAISKPGIFPLSELTYGPAFSQLIDDIRSPELRELLGSKLNVDLSDMPLMITVRGQCQRKDGRIHTDSTDKVVTCLLYLNEPWKQDSGRLRLLRNGHDLDDMIAEVPPDAGTLVAFKRSDNSWHGHYPYEGPRRYIMFNWVRSDSALNWNVGRHKLSARLKRLNPFK